MYLKINIEDSDKWLSTGLWRFVRYPNHSGEILVWIGIFLTSFSSLSQQRNLMLIALASPIVVILNIVFLSVSSYNIDELILRLRIEHSPSV